MATKEQMEKVKNIVVKLRYLECMDNIIYYDRWNNCPKDGFDYEGKVGAYLTKKLEELVEEYDTVKAVKGKGLMQGIQVTKPISEITGAALKEGLLIIGAGSDVIRFVPPLIIELEQVDEMIRILKKAL